MPTKVNEMTARSFSLVMALILVGAAARLDAQLISQPTALRHGLERAWYNQVPLDPNRSITWKHVDGPLTGSVETFRFAALNSGTVVTYEGEVSARNRIFTGPGNRLFVAPQTRAVSLASIEQARRELDNDG